MLVTAFLLHISTDMLYLLPPDEDSEYLPSPEELKGRIIVKVIRLATHGASCVSMTVYKKSEIELWCVNVVFACARGVLYCLLLHRIVQHCVMQYEHPFPNALPGR